MTQKNISQMNIRKVSQLQPLDCFEDYHFGYEQNNNNYLTAYDFYTTNQYKQTKKVKVSQKLTKNKLKRIQIQLQKQQQKMEILNQKRQRFQQLNQFLKEKNILSEQAKQYNINKNDPDIIFKQKNKNYHISPQKQIMIKQKIQMHRAKANQLRQTYAFRIYTKNKQRNDKVMTNKKQIDQKQYNKFEKVHLKQWHNYQKKISQRKQNFNQTDQIKSTNPPDYLYQKYRQKQNTMQKILQEKMQNYLNTKQNDNFITPITIKNQNYTKSNRNIILSKQINNNSNSSQKQLNKKNKDILPMIEIYKKNNTAKDKQKQEKNNYQTINIKKQDKKTQSKTPLDKVYPLEFFGLHLDSNPSSKYTQTRTKKQITQKNLDQMKEFVKNTQSLEISIPEMFQNNEYLDKFQEFLAKEDFIK